MRGVAVLAPLEDRLPEPRRAPLGATVTAITKYFADR